MVKKIIVYLVFNFKYMKGFIISLVLSIALFSCSTDDSQNVKEEPSDLIEDFSLIGEWRWVSSYGGVAGDYWYPPSDHVETVEFNAEPYYLEKVNDEITFEAAYRVIDTVNFHNRNYYTVDFIGHHIKEITFFSDTLSIERGDYWQNYIKKTE